MNAEAGTKILAYIPALNLSITWEMVINFIIASLLCFGFLILIAKSRKMNEEYKEKNNLPPPPPIRKASPEKTPPRIERDTATRCV